jgi:hypothetical protein
MRHIISGDLPTIREWIKGVREAKIKRVIDAPEKRAAGADVPTLETAIIDPRRINQFIAGEGLATK